MTTRLVLDGKAYYSTKSSSLWTMRFPLSVRRFGGYNAAALLLPPAGITLFFWATSPNRLTAIQTLLAGVLLLMAWADYRRWKRRQEQYLPLFALVAMVLWVYYALPLFWGSRHELTSLVPGWTANEDTITASVVMVVLGMLAFGLGMGVRIGRRWVPSRVPRIRNSRASRKYAVAILVLGIASSFYESLPSVLGEGGRQILIILQTTLPAVAFAILFRDFVRGESSQLDRVLIAGYLAVRFFVGISSGWLGSAVFTILLCGLIYLGEKRRLPSLLIALFFATVLFFQVGKEQFRQTYWVRESDQTGKIERVAFWANESLARWEGAFRDPSVDSLRNVTYRSLSRVSLLNQTANVIEMTPSQVPYQYGRLYSYMVVTLIPRFIWPDKPSVNEANRFYQVAYRLTMEDDLGGVSISSGFLAEGYINFGWIGAIGVMFLVGVFFDFFESAFLSKDSGYLLHAIALVLMPGLLTLESQLSVYLGGLLQQVALVLLVLLPVIRLETRASPGGTSVRPRFAALRPAAERLDDAKFGAAE